MELHGTHTSSRFKQHGTDATTCIQEGCCLYTLQIGEATSQSYPKASFLPDALRFSRLFIISSPLCIDFRVSYEQASSDRGP